MTVRYEALGGAAASASTSGGAVRGPLVDTTEESLPFQETFEAKERQKKEEQEQQTRVAHSDTFSDRVLI